MHFKPLIAALALAAIAAPAQASFCIEQTIDGGTTTQTYVAGMSSGGSHNGTAYTMATFCPTGAAAGTCTGESLSEPVAGPIYADRLVDLPDIEQFALLDAKATAKAVAKELLLALIQHRPPQPVAPIYKPFSNGSCN